jgi:excisionase family DNA binding protein
MAQRLQNRDWNQLLSTGKVASVLSVTPDTVLKWIKSGRLPAVRTAGGHYRVARKDVDTLIGSDIVPGDTSGPRGFVYCWEYYGATGGTNARCLDCLVYRARARRCYEMSGLDREAGYAGEYCTTSCDECAYYRDVVQRSRRVLIVTESSDLRQRLQEEGATSTLEVEFAGSEYECSAACAEFRPEYVVIDGALSKRTRSSLCDHLAADPRIPGVTIILALPGDGAAELASADEINRALPRTLNLAELENHIKGLEVTPRIVA